MLALLSLLSTIMAGLNICCAGCASGCCSDTACPNPHKCLTGFMFIFVMFGTFSALVGVSGSLGRAPEISGLLMAGAFLIALFTMMDVCCCKMPKCCCCCCGDFIPLDETILRKPGECEEGHPLEKHEEDPKGSKVCDACSTKITGTGWYACKECDWDVCEACNERNNKRWELEKSEDADDDEQSKDALEADSKGSSGSQEKNEETTAVEMTTISEKLEEKVDGEERSEESLKETERAEEESGKRTSEEPEDPEFQTFVEQLTQNGFFKKDDGEQMTGQEYQDRLERARTQWEEKKSQSQGDKAEDAEPAQDDKGAADADDVAPD